MKPTVVARVRGGLLESGQPLDGQVVDRDPACYRLTAREP